MRGMINLLGPLFTRAFKPGASEVKVALKRSAGVSTTRVTIATPTSGKKIRIISCAISSSNSTFTRLEVYFDTGANITTNAGNEIANPALNKDIENNNVIVWPDGGGPIGGVDEVVSLRTGIDIGTGAGVVIVYREE